jgi:hypothetical protein
MIDKTHPYFSNREALVEELAAKEKHRQHITKSPYGSFRSFYQGNGERALQGHVWTDTWVVGVWATFDGPEGQGKNLSTVFWTVVADDVHVTEFENTGWGETEIVAHAARWFDRNHEL